MYESRRIRLHRTILLSCLLKGLSKRFSETFTAIILKKNNHRAINLSGLGGRNIWNLKESTLNEKSRHSNHNLKNKIKIQQSRHTHIKSHLDGHREAGKQTDS